jgi:peptidoglycan/LPS O-acetylase OafA/YrhL
MWIAYLSWRQEAADSRSMVLWGYSAVGFFCAGCLLLSMVSPSSLAVRCLSWRPLTQLGLISYFVYLAHQPVWFVAHWALRGRPPSHITYFGCAVTLLSVGLTIALGALSYRYFEGPLLRIGRQTNYRSFSQTESDQAEPATCA